MCRYCSSEKMLTAFFRMSRLRQTPDLFAPITQMAGAGEGFFPPIQQLLFPPTDDALADSKAGKHQAPQHAMSVV